MDLLYDPHAECSTMVHDRLPVIGAEHGLSILMAHQQDVSETISNRGQLRRQCC
jgi:hypothetical protein